MSEKPPRARLEALIKELDQPWRSEEALEIAIVELDQNQKPTAKQFGCSTPTISNWVDKLNIGETRVREEQGGGNVCVRCDENETVAGAGNDMCNECITYVRAKDSENGSEESFSDAVKAADGWVA